MIRDQASWKAVNNYYMLQEKLTGLQEPVHYYVSPHALGLWLGRLSHQFGCLYPLQATRTDYKCLTAPGFHTNGEVVPGKNLLSSRQWNIKLAWWETTWIWFLLKHPAVCFFHDPAQRVDYVTNFGLGRHGPVIPLA
ncbi:uncharacterized [Tachysurus ichikawai]